MSATASVAIRWTIGDVSDRGFEALRLSVMGARNIFGSGAAYAVCVNTIPVDAARSRTGEISAGVTWHDTSHLLPDLLKPYLDGGMAEGVGWKLAPLRLFPERYEISLDNDCILWALPPSIERWLGSGSAACLLAEDVRASFGQYAAWCGPDARNAGIRGLPPNFDLEAALREVLRGIPDGRAKPLRLTSELDEQGLQTAALSRAGRPHAVTLDEVTICSPFHPHLPHLGRCGAHFVGLNARHIPWDYYDRPADDWMGRHWDRHRAQLYRNVSPTPEVSCARY